MPYGHVKQYRDLVREAQKKRIRITKEQQKEIRRIYADIADDLSSRLSRHSDQTLTYRWLKDYAKELRRESRGVYRTIQGITEKNMLAVTNAVTGAESAFWSGLVPELSERFTDVFSRVPNSVVNELLSGGVYRDFTGLSERIWNYQGKFNRDIQYVINQGIIAKKPAYDLAKDLEIYLNPKAKKPFDWSRVYPGVHKTVDYNAQRLARTGVTHAYQMSFQRSTRDNPFIEKYKWLSSNSGRSCELCRQRNGRLFEKDGLPLDHPNGMCTVVAVIPKSYEQIADELADWANGKDNPGIDRWLGSDENTEERNDQKTAQKCAENLIVKALQKDKVITPVLKKAAAQGDGHLEGLNYRIKGRDSLVRKLISKSKQKSLSVEEYSEKVTDVLRYTNVSATDNLAKDYTAMVEFLGQKGYNVIEVNNTFQANGPYKGINTLVTDQSGYVFELQYHTPESLRVKEMNHKLYEEQRLDSTSNRRKQELNDQMAHNAESVPVPKNIDKIK